MSFGDGQFGHVRAKERLDRLLASARSTLGEPDH
jgi:hypothetical protein